MCPSAHLPLAPAPRKALLSVEAKLSQQTADGKAPVLEKLTRAAIPVFRRGKQIQRAVPSVPGLSVFRMEDDSKPK